MCAASARPLRLRALRFETCEDRILLSGRPAADFYLDNALPYQPEQTLDQIELALASVHDEYGVTYARNAFGFSGSGQTVAVIDSGIAYDHFALGGGLGTGYRVVGGRDFTEENDADPYDDGPAGFHGTHVAGIVGSDDADFPGVAPAVDLVALRVFNDQGVGYFSWVEKALRWVHTNRNKFEYPITAVTLSLGADWNSDRPPAWATLEDEFAKLNRDGIFIAVAAGNDFTSYGTDGLSYPGASPHVVPVASVGDNGNLSWFSQRHDRVLAAPGANITSTVPDYLFSFDNVPNDYASASGTSMAAPYVAGASVLVREALEFVGATGITQEMIYGYLRSEADLVYDAQTRQSYHRIDIRATLDAIMPADEYGSTAATAHRCGTLHDQLFESGIIGRLNDVDFFRFTAGSSGVVTLSVDAEGELVPDLKLPGGAQQTAAGVFELPVVAGREYVIGIGSADGIGRYTAQIEVATPVADLGTVDLAEFDAQAGDQSYRFTASRQGLVTVEAFLAHASQNVVIRVTDRHGVSVAEVSASGTTAQLDFVGQAGGSYEMSVEGAGDGAHFRITNVFEGVNSSLEITVDDFNGDGRADVLGRSATGHWWVARGTDDGYLSQDAGQWHSRAKWAEVVVGDFNGDGRQDVLGRRASGRWRISFAGETTPRNRFAGRWSTRVQWQDTLTGDFTGDGIDDTLARRADGRWFVADRRTSQGTAQFWGNWGRLNVWTDIFADDYDGDGRLDVIGRTQTGRWFVAHNTGDQFVTRGWGYWNPTADWSHVMTADFTGDGLPDIVGQNSAGHWRLAENTGSRFVNRPWGAWSQSASPSGAIAQDFTLVTGGFTGGGLWDLAGRTTSGERYLSENSNRGFVDVLWKAWEVSHTAPRDIVAPSVQAAAIPATGGMHDFDQWLESDEGSMVAGRLLKTLDPTTGWVRMSRWALR